MKPKIPSGWRRLRWGEKVKRWDRYPIGDDRWEITNRVGERYLEDGPWAWDDPYIRRIRRRQTVYASGPKRREARNSIPNDVLIALAKKSKRKK